MYQCECERECRWSTYACGFEFSCLTGEGVSGGEGNTFVGRECLLNWVEAFSGYLLENPSRHDACKSGDGAVALAAQFLLHSQGIVKVGLPFSVLLKE